MIHIPADLIDTLNLREIVEGIIQAIHLLVTLDPDVMEYARLSLFVSLSATLFATLIALPLGTLIHFTTFFGKKTLIILIQTLYSIPTVFLGLIIYLLISRAGPLGFLNLLYTPESMILGQTVFITPLLLGLIISGLGGVGSDIRLLLLTLGATKFQIVKVILIESRSAILSAVVLGFGRAISEVGIAMILGGNIKDQTMVLTTAISFYTSRGEFAISIALGLLLLFFALIVVALTHLITGRVTSSYHLKGGGDHSS